MESGTTAMEAITALVVKKTHIFYLQYVYVLELLYDSNSYTSPYILCIPTYIYK